MNEQNTKNYIIPAAIAVVAVMLILFITNKQKSSDSTSEVSPDTVNSAKDLNDNDMEIKDIDESDKVADSNSETGQMYAGKILAGTDTPFIEFNKEDYEKALAENKTIYLEYYANWCPSCRAQEANLLPGFDEITNKDVIAFRVNWKDANTDELEQQLADEHGVKAQHHKVIIKDGVVVLNENEIWTKEVMIKTLNEI